MAGGVHEGAGDTSGLEPRAGRATSGPGVARVGRGDSVQGQLLRGQLLAGVRAYFTHPHRELRTARRTWWAGVCGDASLAQGGATRRPAVGRVAASETPGTCVGPTAPARVRPRILPSFRPSLLPKC